MPLVLQHSLRHPLPEHGVLLGALQPSQALLTSQILLPKQTSASTFPSPPPALPAPTRALPPTQTPAGEAAGPGQDELFPLMTTSAKCAGGLAAPAALTPAKR